MQTVLHNKFECLMAFYTLKLWSIEFRIGLIVDILIDRVLFYLVWFK